MTRFAWFGPILYCFAMLIGLLPMALLRRLGALFGAAAYRLDSRETRIARRNLTLIHPEIDDGTRENMTRALMRSMGQGLMETLAIWTRPRARVLRLVQQVHGETHLQAALARGRGVLLAVPHYGNWELLIEFMAARGPFSLVYKASEKAGLECFLQKARSGVNVQLVPAEATAMRPLLRALQNGEVVGITPDQQPRKGGGEFIPFFGRPALTLSLIAKLAQRTGTPVLFAYTERSGDGFDVVFEAEEPALHDAALDIALTAMNRRVQAIAERDFRQYQWTYKRFSIRQDPNTKSPYK
ncbi:MAG: lipid A biosynthesis lauroyl acyltransferase [Arenimonas sp.]